MKKLFTFLTLAACAALMPARAMAAETNPSAVVDLVNRVCGSGASDKFTFTLNDTFNNYNNGGKEAFQLGGTANSITVKANTLSALTCGLNWYLKHDAHIDICWNNLRETPASYPAPSNTDKHESDVKWRYYLNYCTFSYSMAFWDWERWEKELDWMALHGVNLALQCVGIDAVWYQLITNPKTPANAGDLPGLGMSKSVADNFIASPAYQGWWLMNNLQSYGGANPTWWYERQAVLGKQITDRMRLLGITPCLPGFVGMAPQEYHNYLKNNVYSTAIEPYGGKWQGCDSPRIFAVKSTDDNDQIVKAFTELGEKYYDYIQKVYGFMPEAFGLDPFHERGDEAGSADYGTLCDRARKVMLSKSPNAIWVAQEWETNATQYRINALPADEHTLLLDLAAERLSYQSRFGDRNYVFCMLHNYGGNVGMFGGLQHMLDEYFNTHRNRATLKGVGAPPEGIEQNPMMYELLFEMPWLGNKPDAKMWLNNYAKCRYNLSNDDDITNANAAWARLLATVYNQYDPSTNKQQQGCAEPLVCVRPSKFFSNDAEYANVSAWAHAKRKWSKPDVLEAARKLLAVNATNDNYIYDLVDVVRQVLADRSHKLLEEMKALKAAYKTNTTEFADKKQLFLNLIDDSDQLLSFVPDFTMHQWVSRARAIATTTEDKNWMERNARQLLTTWTSSNTTLSDYANREWAGLLKDYYKARWTFYFDNDMASDNDAIYKNVESPYVLGTLPDAAYGKYDTAPTYTAPQVRHRILEMLK